MIDNDICTACGACVNVCPKKCIELDENEYGFYMPKVNKNECVSCGLCKKVCPINKERKKSINWKDSKFYAVWSLNHQKRESGSSGGIFREFADRFIENGGIVYGAAFNSGSNKLIQISSKDIEIDKLCKSKYVESNTTGTFEQIKKNLLEKREVLYCGTSCQIDGLLSFLGKEYSNLYLCDFLCHGVPGIGIYTKYIHELEKKYGKLNSIGFRSKEFGWESYCIKAEFENKSQYIKTKFDDPYVTLFLENYIVRDSCLTCNRVKDSQADITLGDYWNVKKNKNIKNDDKGISLVSVHSKKGQVLFDKISNNCCVYTLNSEDVAYAYKIHCNNPKDRKIILDEIKRGKSIFKVYKKKYIKAILYRLRSEYKRIKRWVSDEKK